MKHTIPARAALCLALAALFLLSGCAAIGPRALDSAQTLAAAAVSVPAREVTVDSVDALLAALASNTTVYLKPGVYDLSTAADYGRDTGGAPYFWRETYDGYELVLCGLEGLTIAGMPDGDAAETVIAAVPRYANVLCFDGCRGLTLSGLTAGHTEEPGLCCGGVLCFIACSGVRLTGCRLYGCGTLGIESVNCDALWAEGCAIYDCSYGAVQMQGSWDLRLVGCEIHDCGMEDEYAGALFNVTTSTGFAVVDSEVYGNRCLYLLSSNSSEEVYLLGTSFTGNRFDTYFAYNAISPMVGGCSFTDNVQMHELTWDGRDFVFLPGDGGQIAVSDLESMELDRSAYAYDGPVMAESVSVEGVPGETGMEYHVTSADEFLAALGSDRTVFLDAALFDLSTASNYGGRGGEHYRWNDGYDGPELLITGVRDLRIVGQGKDETTLEAVPRCAAVLRFDNCENVTVASLTAGHRKGEPGSCTGDVLAFESCRSVQVSDCGLYGCGVWGLRADNCTAGEILRTEIYECSEGAATLWYSDGFVFTDCSVHDCYSPWWQKSVNVVSQEGSADCSYNGMPLRSGVTEVGDGGLLQTGAVNGSLSLHAYLYESEIGAEGLTLHAGDEPIVIYARVLGDGAEHSFLWGVTDPNLFDFTPNETGVRCRLAPIPGAEGDGTLLVLCSDAGLSLEIPVHVA